MPISLRSVSRNTSQDQIGHGFEPPRRAAQTRGYPGVI
jgi:hypothetical protein